MNTSLSVSITCFNLLDTRSGFFSIKLYQVKGLILDFLFFSNIFTSSQGIDFGIFDFFLGQQFLIICLLWFWNLQAKTDRPEPDQPEPDRPEPDRLETDRLELDWTARPTRPDGRAIPERHPRSRGFPRKKKKKSADRSGSIQDKYAH